MTDFLDEKRREITKRLQELKPLVDEFNRLEAAAAALTGAVGSAASDAGHASVRRRGRRRRHGSAMHRATVTAPAPSEADTAAAATGKRTASRAKAARRPAARAGKRRAGRPGSGARAVEAVSLIQGQPGVTTPELAAKIGITTSYLYRVLPGPEKDGKIRKDGRGWHAR